MLDWIFDINNTCAHRYINRIQHYTHVHACNCWATFPNSDQNLVKWSIFRLVFQSYFFYFFEIGCFLDTDIQQRYLRLFSLCLIQLRTYRIHLNSVANRATILYHTNCRWKKKEICTVFIFFVFNQTNNLLSNTHFSIYVETQLLSPKNSKIRWKKCASYFF